ncbi:hypothetical protein PVW47_01595 [Marinovum sp. SP66]|uniref:hypothetical protein n=1 Tax=Marinovum TaxID=367771 RepID=UPI00237BC610|nr:hypothetical protein [Marinovum sp. SP66]MDD9738467.1 hypothetical protein [Marinovum sp. SP66]
MKDIPISAAKDIAQRYGYDQVMILARKVDTFDEEGGEHVTTYGVDPENCEVAARIGTTVKHHLMGWPSQLFTSDLNVSGIGRDARGGQTVNLFMNGAVSDEGLRALHDFLNPNS